MDFNERKKLAEEFIKQDRYPDAFIEYSNLFKEKPNDETVKAKLLFLWDRIEAGNYDFQPDTSDEFVMRGNAKFYKGELHSAVNDFNKAIGMDPQNDYALKCRAFTFTVQGYFDNAISDLNKAIQINPAGEYFDDLATIYFNFDPEKAFEYHEKAIKASPNDERLWYNFGVDLMDIGLLNKALKKFDKAIELWPDYEDAIENKKYILSVLRS